MSLALFIGLPVFCALVVPVLLGHSRYGVGTGKICRTFSGNLARGALLYAQDYDAVLPPAARWQDAVAAYVHEPDPFRCPGRPQAVPGYAYVAPLGGVPLARIGDRAGQPLLFDSSLGRRNGSDRLESFVTPHAGEGALGYADGHAGLAATAPAPDAGLTQSAPPSLKGR